MNYAIRIRSKHTGNEATLGYRYPTRAEAHEAAAAMVCTECNTFEIVPERVVVS